MNTHLTRTDNVYRGTLQHRIRGAFDVRWQELCPDEAGKRRAELLLDGWRTEMRLTDSGWIGDAAIEGYPVRVLFTRDLVIEVEEVGADAG